MDYPTYCLVSIAVNITVCKHCTEPPMDLPNFPEPFTTRQPTTASLTTAGQSPGTLTPTGQSPGTLTPTSQIPGTAIPTSRSPGTPPTTASLTTAGQSPGTLTPTGQSPGTLTPTSQIPGTAIPTSRSPGTPLITEPRKLEAWIIAVSVIGAIIGFALVASLILSIAMSMRTSQKPSTNRNGLWWFVVTLYYIWTFLLYVKGIFPFMAEKILQCKNRGTVHPEINGVKETNELTTIEDSNSPNSADAATASPSCESAPPLIT